MKYLFTWLLLLCITSKGLSQSANSRGNTLPLRNAYETAKALYAADISPKKLSDSLRQQLLGSLVWYADLQDAQGDLYEQLLEKLKPYPFVERVRNKLSDSLIKFGKFFELDSATVIQSASHLSEPVQASLKSMKSLYIKKNADYVAAKTAYRSFTADLRTTSAALVLRRQQTIFTFDSLVRLQTDTIERNNIKNQAAGLVDAIENQIHQVNQQYDSARAAFLLLENGFNQWKTIVLQQLKDQRNTLLSFLYRISGITEQTGRQGLSFEDALNSFNLNTLPDIQKVISEAEAAYKVAFRLPSEAEMINALAIYLANRIKQESVMWFFEKITQNASRYELLNLFFPTTMKLLQGNEVYEIPNLGAQWQICFIERFYADAQKCTQQCLACKKMARSCNLCCLYFRGM